MPLALWDRLYFMRLLLSCRFQKNIREIDPSNKISSHVQSLSTEFIYLHWEQKIFSTICGNSENSKAKKLWTVFQTEIEENGVSFTLNIRIKPTNVFIMRNSLQMWQNSIKLLWNGKLADRCFALQSKSIAHKKQAK